MKYGKEEVTEYKTYFDFLYKFCLQNFSFKKLLCGEEGEERV
jgi:hypothetical protein